jgi:TolB protein
MMRSSVRLCVCAVAISLAPFPDASAQKIEGVVEGQFTKIKIAVPDADGARDTTTSTELSTTLRDDLTFSGLFDVVDPSLYRLVPAPGAKGEPHTEWLSIGANAVVRLRIVPAGERIDVEARLYDNTGGGQLFARRYGGQATLVRRVAHQIADDLVKHYTGRPGIALTLLCFVCKTGNAKEVYLADYDGQRVRRITTSNTINLVPAWSPDGDELAFVSFRGKQPGVYLMSSEGKLKNLPTVGGELSSAPDFSPDGKRLAYTSDVDGNSEIYLLDRTTGRNTRLTRNPGIDTAPAWAPNGREIAFTSDRSGSPQIYLMDAEGLNVRRVSWEGPYNDSAAWSPDGSKLAYVSRIDGRFEVQVRDLSTDRSTRLTSGGGNNENPRWSPDGRHIVFASNRGGTWDIYTMRADGQDVRRVTKGSDCSTPDWSH